MQSLVLGSLLREESTRVMIFWYCNNVSFFFAVAFWEGRVQFVKALSYVGILPQLLWLADFLSHLLGFDLSNTANYVFVEGFTFSNNVTVLIHFGIPLIALYYVAHIRPKPYSLFYSFLFAGGMYIATIAGTFSADDINCVFNACSQYPFAYHIVLWPLYMAILTLGGYALHEGLYLLLRRYRSRSWINTAID